METGMSEATQQQRRMKRHGGRATIRSTPGDGTEVELTMTRTTKVQQ